MFFSPLPVHATLLKSGDAFFDKMAELIKEATSEIHLQTYIFEDDQTGNLILDLLKISAKRGVKIYMLLDAYGCIDFPESLMNELRKSGINIRKYSLPVPFLRLYTGKRLHHKVLVVDSHHAIIGGINIANRYSGYDGVPPWLDYAVSISGEPCKKVALICSKLFFKIKFKPFKVIKNRLKLFGKKTPDKEAVQVVWNDWYRQRFEISRSYRQALRDSKSEVIILASYFLPGIRIKKLLKQATIRGVQISIVLPCKPDVALFKHASVYLYNWMLRNKISVYEFQPGMLHAKCGLFDKKWCTIGSFNLISLSEYGSVEMNVNVLDDNFTSTVDKEFAKVIKHYCRQIDRNDLEKSSGINRISNWISFQLLRLMMYVYLALSTDTES